MNGRVICIGDNSNCLGGHVPASRRGGGVYRYIALIIMAVNTAWRPMGSGKMWSVTCVCFMLTTWLNYAGGECCVTLMRHALYDVDAFIPRMP
jgi:hypothetical protein